MVETEGKGTKKKEGIKIKEERVYKTDS